MTKYLTITSLVVLVIGYLLGAYYGAWGKNLISKVTG